MQPPHALGGRRGVLVVSVARPRPPQMRGRQSDPGCRSDVSRKLCPKIIIEGTRLTLKTEIAFALNDHPRIVGPRKYRYHSPLVSAEWCAFTDFPWGRGLINFEPQEEALALETYSAWVRLFELQRYYSWIIDRFHASTQVYQLRAHQKAYDFSWLERRLVPLGFRVVLCVRTAESFESARAARLLISGNPAQYSDLSVFIAEQELFRVFVGRSQIPSLSVDVSDNDVPRAVTEIADWLENTGGLYTP